MSRFRQKPPTCDVSGSVSCIPEKKLKLEQPRLDLAPWEVSAVPLRRCNKKEHGRKCYPSVTVFSIVCFPPSISARPCPGTPIVSFVLSSIKKGRRCPIKSKMVDTVIFHNAILGLCVLLLRYTGDWHSVLLKNCC